MNVVKPARIVEFKTKHPLATSGLDDWLRVAKAGKWTCFEDLRPIFGRKVDEVIVASRRRVVIFDIGGNKFRLIVAIHYNRQRVFVLMFLTHAEYSKNLWKNQL